jgi:hypothetical protein
VGSNETRGGVLCDPAVKCRRREAGADGARESDLAASAQGGVRKLRYERAVPLESGELVAPPPSGTRSVTDLLPRLRVKDVVSVNTGRRARGQVPSPTRMERAPLPNTARAQKRRVPVLAQASDLPESGALLVGELSSQSRSNNCRQKATRTSLPTGQLRVKSRPVRAPCPASNTLDVWPAR